VQEAVLAEGGRAVYGPVQDVLRQVRRLRAVGAVRQQGRVPLLQGHEIPQERPPKVPLDPLGTGWCFSPASDSDECRELEVGISELCSE
jgi:hypothetical protein